MPGLLMKLREFSRPTHGTDAVRTALGEIVALRRFKKLTRKHAGRHKFAGWSP
jgi:hypothetical protein